MSREEHLAWCKARALEYCDRGDTTEALTSMFSDLGKHPDTAKHPGILIGVQLIMIGSLGSKDEARHFINGFN